MGALVTRAAQNLLLILVGAAALWITLATDEYLDYVRPGFRFLLVAAAVALIALGAAGVHGDRRRGDGDDGPDHAHHEGPRVAWLLCLPALAIFVIAPPALGSFTASRDTARTPPSGERFGALRRGPAGAPTEMTLGEYIGRSFEAQMGDPAMRGLPVKLTGFATPGAKGAWHLNRLRMSCCAGDAIALRVVVHGATAPPAGSWVQVVGTWRPPRPSTPATGTHELTAARVHPITKPRNAYER
jgi:uncharacterized repeat protein (TIGR03943 family)